MDPLASLGPWHSGGATGRLSVARQVQPARRHDPIALATTPPVGRLTGREGTGPDAGAGAFLRVESTPPVRPALPGVPRAEEAERRTPSRLGRGVPCRGRIGIARRAGQAR